MSAEPDGWPVLVLGAQRSGTTAFAYALAEALREAGAPFTVNGRLPYVLRRWWTREEIAARHPRADDVAHALRRRPPAAPDRDAWLARAQSALDGAARRAAEAPQPPAVDEEVRRICRETYGSARWGDKYNEYLLDLPWLLHVFPRARWIFLCRDPHEVIASMLAWREKPWNPVTVNACALKWADWTQRWLDARPTIEPDRRVELAYDDICAGRVDKASALLGIDLRPTLRRYRRQPQSRRVAAIPQAANELWETLLTITATQSAGHDSNLALR